MPRRFTLIVNCAAGRGRAARLLDRALFALSRVAHVDVAVTAFAGHERELARRAVHDGAHAVVVLGGDGTVSHVVRALVAERATMPLAVLAAGTGNDLAKSLRSPVRDYARTAQLLADGVSRAVDVGCIDDVPFVNAAGFGFDAAVLAHMMQDGAAAARGGATAYASSAIRHLFGYRGFSASIASNASAAQDASDAEDTRQRWLMIVFANGGWFGGMFRVAPDARVDDGALDCIAVRDASAPRRAMLFARAMRGGHVGMRDVRVERGARFTLRFDAPPLYQADGELQQARSSTVRVGVLPGALRVVSEIASDSASTVAQDVAPEIASTVPSDG